MYNAPSQEDLSDAIFVHMVEMTILVTRLIVEFAKSLPGFRNLVKEDQIVLLKVMFWHRSSWFGEKLWGVVEWFWG